MICYDMLCYAILCYIILHYIIHEHILRCIIMYYVIVSYMMLYDIMLYHYVIVYYSPSHADHRRTQREIYHQGWGALFVPGCKPICLCKAFSCKAYPGSCRIPGSSGAELALGGYNEERPRNPLSLYYAIFVSFYSILFYFIITYSFILLIFFHLWCYFLLYYIIFWAVLRLLTPLRWARVAQKETRSSCSYTNDYTYYYYYYYYTCY